MLSAPIETSHVGIVFLPHIVCGDLLKFVSMTEAEYKALETKSPSTIYHLTDVSMWAIGDQEIVTSNMPV